MNGHQKQREQSGRMIEEALFSLMEEKPYVRIRVSEIVERADVSRRTFYRLYKEKDEVLRCFLGRLCREYRRQAPELECYDVSRIAGDFFGFWYRYRDLLLLIYKSGVDEMLYYEISRASIEVVKGRIKGRDHKNADGIGYFAQYSAGGFILLLWQWIQSGMNGTAEEYAERVSQALLTFIRPESI